MIAAICIAAAAEEDRVGLGAREARGGGRKERELVGGVSLDIYSG